MRSMQANSRWEETDVPWDDIDDDGVTEPEDEFPGPDEDEEF